MRRERKPVIRWIGEALLIFISVIAAFYFDSYRESRNLEKQYLRYLTDFKKDLEENQGKFNYELNSEYIKSNGQGYIKGEIEKLQLMDSLMSTPSRQNANEVLQMIDDGVITGLTKWIFISPQHEKLQSEYYSFIKNEGLSGRLQMHYRANDSRISVKDVINDYVKEFRDIEDQLRVEDGSSQTNRSIIFSNVSVNKVRRLKNSYVSLKNMTLSAKESDSLILVQINRELELWGRSSKD